MVFEHIEKLKREFTDKYVVVDASQPELTRFRNATGQIKTVNMNGRALVEFDQWDNIGWYDIELDFLKVVPKPEPKVAEAKKEPAAKTAAAKPAAPVAKPAAAAPTGGKPSTADILAAARMKKGTGEPVAAKPAAPVAPTAKATPPKPAPAAKTEPGKKMSTAEILAMARGKGVTAATASAPASTVKKPPTPEKAAPEKTEEPAAETSPVVEPAAKPTAKGPAGPKPTTTADIIAYCRKTDAKS